MILNDVDFGFIFWAAGSVNFFGEGWWYDPYLKLIPGYESSGITETYKTTPLESRLGPEFGELGNMPLNNNLQSRRWFPDCVKIYWFKGLTLNSIGLSGPGLKVLLERKGWQNKIGPKIISIMATGPTKESRLCEMATMGKMFRKEIQKNFPYFPRWVRNTAFEQNISCPNVEHDPIELGKESIGQLLYFRAGLTGFFDHVANMDFESAHKIVRSIPADRVFNEIINESGPFGKISTGIKMTLLSSPSLVRVIVDSGLCDFISIPNTVSWGKLPNRIAWRRLFKSNVSPLAKYGGGGLSGWPLTPLTAEWILNCRNEGVKIPINAGSIYKVGDVDLMHSAGASGIVIGCVKFLRPWRLKSIRRRAKELYTLDGTRDICSCRSILPEWPTGNK